MATMPLVIKGPLKSAKRAAHRHGITVRACKIASRSPTTGSETIVCDAVCTPSTNRAVAFWYGEREYLKERRGYPPGTLTFHGAFCAGTRGLRGRRRK